MRAARRNLDAKERPCGTGPSVRALERLTIRGGRRVVKSPVGRSASPRLGGLVYAPVSLKSTRRIAGDNPGLSTSPGLSLMVFGRGPLPRRPSSGVTRARSRRSSSIRARIAGKSSAARGRGDWGSIIGKLGKQGEGDRLDNYG